MFIVMIKDLVSASNKHLQAIWIAHHNSNTTNKKGRYLLLPNIYQDVSFGLDSIPSHIPTNTTDISWTASHCRHFLPFLLLVQTIGKKSFLKNINHGYLYRTDSVLGRPATIEFTPLETGPTGSTPEADVTSPWAGCDVIESKGEPKWQMVVSCLRARDSRRFQSANQGAAVTVRKPRRSRQRDLLRL